MTESEFTEFATDGAREHLSRLIGCEESNFPVYREIMSALGGELAQTLIAKRALPQEQCEVVLSCSVEDADFLAKGFLDKLEAATVTVRLACFWNQSTFSPFGYEEFEIAPIAKSYIEPVEKKDCDLVIIKSIISGACVVATNITRLISDLNPKRIFVCAPVMLAGAEERLASNFDNEMSSKFQYIAFRIDHQKEGSNVVPGVGGNVYFRYGFQDEQHKNQIVPELVEKRRELIAN